MNIEDLTVKQVKELTQLVGGHRGVAASESKRLPFANIGENVFVATITAHYTGCVTAVSEEEVQLTDAAWIADDGRFSQAMEKGEYSEVEPFPDDVLIVLNRSMFLFWRRIPQQLPRTQK